MHFQRATARRRVQFGSVFICLWLGVAIAGRMIAFVHG
jgi:hypothetical protein